MRTITCPTCHQTLTGNWTVVRCYCTEWTPRSRDGIGDLSGLGDLIGRDEIVRITQNGTLSAEDISALMLSD